MKKLLLVPAIAVAITGLAAAPVIADSNQSFQQGVAEFSGKVSTDNQDNKKAFVITVSVDPAKLTQTELVDPGVTITVSGLQAGDEVTDDLTGETFVAEAETASFSIYNSTEDPTAIDPGVIEFEVTAVRGEETASAKSQFTVLPDEAPAEDPTISGAQDELSVSDFKKDGLAYTGENFAPEEEVTIEAGSDESGDLIFEETVTADAEGKIAGTITAEGDLPAGEYSVYAYGEESQVEAEPFSFTLTEDATEEPTEEPTTPVADAALTVSPKTITPADFVDEKKGVKLTVENCEPGADVKFTVNPKSAMNVTAYENTVKADDKGMASVSVYGTSSTKPSEYIGDYAVTVTCGDDELKGEFTVGEEANGGGSDGKDSDGNGNGGSDLPRTGAELTGLASGAALLLIGGAVVTLTMRRKKSTGSPSDI